MTAVVIWMLALTISLCITVLSAASDSPGLHMGMTGLVSLGIAIFGVQSHRALLAQGASASALAAQTARASGLVWVWAALAIFVTYNFILSWREWWVFVLALVLIGGLCIAFSLMFNKDTAAGRDDEALLGFARTLGAVQAFGMFIAMIGIVADGKLSWLPRAGHGEWAANNIFFFGAFAIACIGANALISERKAKSASEKV
jgi:hypothetical protein